MQTKEGSKEDISSGLVDANTDADLYETPQAKKKSLLSGPSSQARIEFFGIPHGWFWNTYPPLPGRTGPLVNRIRWHA